VVGREEGGCLIIYFIVKQIIYITSNRKKKKSLVSYRKRYKKLMILPMKNNFYKQIIRMKRKNGIRIEKKWRLDCVTCLLDLAKEVKM